MTMPLPDFTPDDLPFVMHGGEPYDRERDYGLDFPDEPRSEPELQEVKDRITYYEQHPWPVDVHSGVRDA